MDTTDCLPILSPQVSCCCTLPLFDIVYIALHQNRQSNYCDLYTCIDFWVHKNKKLPFTQAYCFQRCSAASSCIVSYLGFWQSIANAWQQQWNKGRKLDKVERKSRKAGARSGVRWQWWGEKLLLATLGNIRTSFFGLQNTLGSTSRSLGSGMPSPASEGLSDADWGIQTHNYAPFV